MKYADALAYLYSQLPMFTRVGAKAYNKDLDKTIQLCALLENPQDNFHTIHVAGTNGKGSVSHALASIFQEAGYKTGLYTSPHIKDFRERIKINGQYIPKKTVSSFLQRYQIAIMTIAPSFFELTVALAFDYFAKQRVDIAIIETGLGGRLDSTNIIKPLLSVITNISFDHKDLLGDTLEQIAREKAGIIKQHTPVVIGRKDNTTAAIFRAKAAQEKAPLYFAEDIERIESQSTDQTTGMALQSQSLGNLHTDLKGSYQLENIQTVIAAIACFQKHNTRFILSQENIRKGINNITKNTGLTGRWQLLQYHPRVILDVGHNEDGVRKIIEQLSTESYQQLHIIYGAVGDKDISAILQLLPKQAHYYLTEPSIPRKLPIATLRALTAKIGLQSNSYKTPQKAFSAACKKAQANDLILIMGSFFIAAEILDKFKGKDYPSKK